MSDAGTKNVVERQQAKVPWGDLLPDVLLLFTGALAMVLFFIVDACCACHYAYFPRSGAIAALIGGVVAFRSLNKHYKKFLNYSDLSKGTLHLEESTHGGQAHFAALDRRHSGVGIRRHNLCERTGDDAKEPTANHWTIQLHISSTRQSAATCASARGGSSCSR